MAAKPVITRSPNKPRYRRAVDGTKYAAMKKILLRFFPKKPPGKTQTQMWTRVRSANKRLFGKTGSWWAKCVQLDLEARGKLVREKCTPLRWHRR